MNLRSFSILLLLNYIQCGWSTNDVEFGLTQAEKVAKAICRIEYFDNATGDDYEICLKSNSYSGKLLYLQNSIRRRSDAGEDTTFEEQGIYATSMRLTGNAVKDTLEKYSSCIQQLENESQPPKIDYGWVLGDSDREYPYKTFSHCLLQVVENLHGKETLEKLKEELENPKTVQEAMLNAENRNRALHGAPPMELDSELTIRAQRWADYLAEVLCEMKHMSRVDVDRSDLYYKDRKLGENIYNVEGEMYLSYVDVGECAAFGWYKEIKDYPWPMPVYKGVHTGKMIGHFTQSVWKETSLVGYAIKRGVGKCQKVFAVARYWPSGNVMSFDDEEYMYEAYEANVLPLINQN